MVTDWDNWDDQDDTDAWEEALQYASEKAKQERFNRLPEICQKCRWMDWYIAEACVYRLPRPQNDQCRFFSCDLRRPNWAPRRLIYWIWDWQWRWWKFKNRHYTTVHCGFVTPEAKYQTPNSETVE